MPKIRTVVDVYLPVAQLAEAFADLDGDEMAQFFNSVAEKTKTWETPGWSWCKQASYVAASDDLTDEGRALIRKLAEHVEGAA